MTRAQQIETVRRGAFLRAAIAAGLCAAVALALLLTGCSGDVEMPPACHDKAYACASWVACPGIKPLNIVTDGCATFSRGVLRYRKGSDLYEKSAATCYISYECVRPADDAK